MTEEEIEDEFAKVFREAVTEEIDMAQLKIYRGDAELGDDIWPVITHDVSNLANELLIRMSDLDPMYSGRHVKWVAQTGACSIRMELDNGIRMDEYGISVVEIIEQLKKERLKK